MVVQRLDHHVVGEDHQGLRAQHAIGARAELDGGEVLRDRVEALHRERRSCGRVCRRVAARGEDDVREREALEPEAHREPIAGMERREAAVLQNVSDVVIARTQPAASTTVRKEDNPLRLRG